MARIFLQPLTLKRFEAIQRCLVPRCRNFNESQWRQSRELINTILSEKGRSFHFKLRAFLFLIDVVSLFYGTKIFSALSENKKNSVMYFFFDSKIKIFRVGFWGLNTLAKLGVYGQASIYSDINYTPREVRHV